MEVWPLTNLKTNSEPRKFKSRPSAVRQARPAPAAGELLLADLLAEPFLAVEIGCGVGLHAIQYASEFPDRSMIAIERTNDKFASFARRLGKHPHLKNRLCAVHADAFQYLDENFPRRSIDEVWIMYPNPEPKKAARRWFFAPFTGRLIELLKPGAKLFLSTNIDSYARDCVRMAGDFQLVVERSDAFSRLTRPDWKPRTHFEKKYYERGETIFDITFGFTGTERIQK